MREHVVCAGCGGTIRPTRRVTLDQAIANHEPACPRARTRTQ